MFERLTVITCDAEGCQEALMGQNYRKAQTAGTKKGWSFKGGEFCPAHYPLERCLYCDRPMRPWTRHSGDPGMEGTIAKGAGGYCQHCSKHRLAYERMLDRAVETYYRMARHGYA